MEVLPISCNPISSGPLTHTLFLSLSLSFVSLSLSCLSLSLFFILPPSLPHARCRAGCGGPPVNWQTAKDSTAPPGWKVSGFSGNVGNQRQCAGGWNAYRGGSGQGTLSTTLKGSGTVTAKYRDCWREGHASMYLNGKLVGQSGNRNGALQTTRCFANLPLNVRFAMAKPGTTTHCCTTPAVWLLRTATR